MLLVPVEGWRHRLILQAQRLVSIGRQFAGKACPALPVLSLSTQPKNIYQAESVGCQIITVPNGILAKRKNVGKDLMEYSLDTVKGFARDIETLGFHILP